MFNGKTNILDNDESIFNFLDPNKNDKLSDMSGVDLQELICYLENYYLKLRAKLGFNNSVTFGLELEFENAMLNRIYRSLMSAFPNDDWKFRCDYSLNEGAEIDSPILKDDEVVWENLKEVCFIVNPLASIDKNSGGHIHVGAHILGNNKESWLNFIKMWSVYENIIFRFAYGEFLTARPNILKYAEPVAEKFWTNYENLKDDSLEAIIYKISGNKYQAVNFRNVFNYGFDSFNIGNTIEFRCPNGSLNPIIWQNNVNFFVKLLNYSKDFNDDIVQKRYQLNLDKFTGLKWYDEIYLEQALELCDMIFSNNLDKIYFLKQYLKSFQVYKRGASYFKTCGLTKRL